MPAAVTTRCSSNQAATFPDELYMATQSQWLFTEQELLQSPSIRDGLPQEKERENRSKGVNFIVQVGIMLKLPQITLATASIFLHRFYMRHPMQSTLSPHGHHYYSIAATSLFLATKVEENCRKMKELVIACVRVAQKDPYKIVDEQDKEYWRWRDNILLNEDILLEALCFDLRLEPPYKILYDVLLRYGEEDNKRLRNAAWAFISDSCLTTLCLLFPSQTIAASALYAAAKHSCVAFPDDQEGRSWWECIDVDLADIGRACNYMAEVYRGAPMQGARDMNLYEKSPNELDGASDTTRTGSDGRIQLDQSAARPAPVSLKRTAVAETQSNGVNGLLANTNRKVSGSPRKRQRLSNSQEPIASTEAPTTDALENAAERAEQSQPNIHDSANDNTTSKSIPVRQPIPEDATSKKKEGLPSPKLEGSEDGEVDH